MSLPRPSLPYYTCVIPSTKKKIKYRPFTVKEEKILMLASESKNSDEIINALETVIVSCIDGDINIKELAIFDIEYLFLRLRAKSVGEKIELRTIAPDDKETLIDITVDIDKVDVYFPPDHKNKIKLKNGLLVVMKYPNIDFFNDDFNLEDINVSSSLLARCISQIVDGEEVIQAADQSEEDLKEWVDGLLSSDYLQLENFFRTIPRIRHTVNTKNPKTGADVKLEFVGLSDFFT